MTAVPLICDLSSPPDCGDPNPRRWHCMRGYTLEAAFNEGVEKPAEPGVCHLKKCARTNPTEREQAMSTTPRPMTAVNDIPDEAVEALCEVMHDAYEAAAIASGWETQQRSRKPWSDVPEANKSTMRVAVRALLIAAAPALIEHAVAERDAARAELERVREAVEELAAIGERDGRGNSLQLARRLRAVLGRDGGAA